MYDILWEMLNAIALHNINQTVIILLHFDREVQGPLCTKEPQAPVCCPRAAPRNGEILTMWEHAGRSHSEWISTV